MMSGYAFILFLAPFVHSLRLVQKPNDVDHPDLIRTQSEAALLQSASDALWKEMEQAMQTLVEQKKSTEVRVLQLLKPCAKCSAPKRYGEANDGGYAMCSELIEDGKATAGYSLGINGFDGWGRDLSSKLHVPVYQYDCTNPTVPDCTGGNCQFRELCITAETTKTPSKPQYKTMLELMALNGHGNRGDVKDLIMQLDVESYEWDLFADPSTAEQMKEFSQLSVEYHGILQKSACCADAPMETKLKALENMNRMFVVTHLHGNNYEGMQAISTQGKSYSVPSVIEVLYVRRGLIQEQKCLAEPQILDADRPNNPGARELPSAHLR